MKKILYTSLTGYPQNNSGGGNRIVYELIKNLSVKEYSRMYCSYPFFKDYGNAPLEADLIKYLPNRSKIGLKLWNNVPMYRLFTSSRVYRMWYSKRIESYLSRQSDILKPHVIHAHDPISLYYFRKNTAKKILTMHFKGGYVREMIDNGSLREVALKSEEDLKKYEDTTFQAANIVTFPSSAAMRLYFANNNVEPDQSKIRVVYNGVDIDNIINTKFNISELKNIGIPIHKNYIVNIAQHIKQKNIIGLLKALKNIKEKYDRNIYLINIGDGPDTHLYLDYINQHGLKDNVKFIGKVDNRIALQVIKKSKCFVLLSYNVVFDLVVLEALACGIPVIVSNEGGNREVIQNGINGYLVDPNNEHEIIDAICSNDKIKISQNALKSVKRFSVQEMVKNYQNIYYELCN